MQDSTKKVGAMLCALPYLAIYVCQVAKPEKSPFFSGSAKSLDKDCVSFCTRK